MPRQKKADAFGIGTVFSFKFKSDRRFGLGPRKDAFIFVLNFYVFFTRRNFGLRILVTLGQMK